MADAGKLTLRLHCGDGRVQRVEIASSRPQAARLLVGRTSQQAEMLAPLLFNVCGRAQGAAAQAALARAEGREVQVDEASLASEAIQEHLWRLLLDWPQALGLPPQKAEYARWRSALQQGRMNEVAEAWARDWLGLPLADVLPPDVSALRAWWQTAHSPAAQLLAALATNEGLNGAVQLLPQLTAAQAAQAFAGRWGEALARQPDWQGVAAETGALAAFPALAQHPARQLAGVLARVAMVARLLEGRAASALDSAQEAPGVGLACVQTARGLLMHRAVVEAGKVRDYCIVAPTEWNFHPQGALVQALTGLPCTGLEQRVRRWVLALDPCVEYGIEVMDA
jgi:hypothetical protein